MLPFISLPEYARLLRRLGQTYDQDSYTPFGLLSQLGASDRVAQAVTILLGLAVIVIAWRLRSFVLFVAAALMLSPIVWLDYYAVLAVPLAIVRPRLSPIWLLPLLTWGMVAAGYGIGHVETSSPHARRLRGGHGRGGASRAAPRLRVRAEPAAPRDRAADVTRPQACSRQQRMSR